MLSDQEMRAVVDRATSLSYDGQLRVCLVQVRDELEHSYGFDSLLTHAIVLRMQDRGLLCE